MRHRIGLLTAICVFWSAQTVLAAVNQNTRLLQKAEWDGAVIVGNWLSGEFRYQRYDQDIDALVLGQTFATAFPRLPLLELGGRFWVINADYDDTDDEFGIGDIDCWGKYQFLSSGPLQVSGGMMLSLPLGSDKVLHPRATGAINMELFTAARYQVSREIIAIGHFGIRKNGDMDIDLAGVDWELDGEIQLELGGGVLVDLTPTLNVSAELNFASEPYDSSDNDIELTGGAEYLLQQNMSLTAGLGLGLDDGAPEAELIVGYTLSF
ncbi:MAG: hypothetical protein CSA22_00580 [Deltaproteobacteria bacterium]|nr:MAG: hypothetical protein CSA22_00580 [Deltaproteobacteria bacterium]